jgi:predicted membrane GTPase involved in stress response
VKEYVKNAQENVSKDEIIDLLEHNDADDEKLHLSILYASPLGYEVADGLGGKKFKQIAELDFPNDLQQITKALQGGKNKVNYSIRIGTPINFISSLSK